MGMQGILAGVSSNCSATRGAVSVESFEAFVNTMLDGWYLGERHDASGQPAGYWYTPEAQMGAFDAIYSRSGGTVDITVTNTISLNSLFLHAPAHLGINDRNKGSLGNVNQELHITATDPCSGT
jgi:hypothetical protein